MAVEVNFLWYLNIIVKFLVVVVVSGLVKIYLESYKKIKVSYTIGLLMFSIIFLVSAIFAFIFTLLITFNPHDAHSLTINGGKFIESIIQLIAMSILYKITKDE